jgi:hypothetical protein
MGLIYSPLLVIIITLPPHVDYTRFTDPVFLHQACTRLLKHWRPSGEYPPPARHPHALADFLSALASLGYSDARVLKALASVVVATAGAGGVLEAVSKPGVVKKSDEGIGSRRAGPVRGLSGVCDPVLVGIMVDACERLGMMDYNPGLEKLKEIAH